MALFSIHLFLLGLSGMAMQIAKRLEGEQSFKHGQSVFSLIAIVLEIGSEAITMLGPGTA